MPLYALVFLAIAVISAVFGYHIDMNAGAVGVARILTFIFTVMAAITIVLSLIQKGR